MLMLTLSTLLLSLMLHYLLMLALHVVIHLDLNLIHSDVNTTHCVTRSDVNIDHTYEIVTYLYN